MHRIIPHVEYHQHRYARALGEVTRGFDRPRWLDIGAGTRLHGGWEGESQEVLAERAKYIIGCDFVVEHLRENPLLTGAVGADAGALPFADGSFEIVSANMVLEHLDRPERVFAEVYRVLAPGGRFVFVTPNSEHPVVVFFSLLPRRFRSWVGAKIEGREEEHVFPTHYRANSSQRVRSLAAEAGLETDLAEAFPSFPMTLRKPLPFFLAESMMIAASRGPLRRFTSNLLGVLRKPT